jgi:hypothetical protein
MRMITSMAGWGPSDRPWGLYTCQFMRAPMHVSIALNGQSDRLKGLWHAYNARGFHYGAGTIDPVTFTALPFSVKQLCVQWRILL